MNRSFTNRVFGGVCGGLAESSLPLPAWFWRVAFVLLSLLTLGAAAAVYLLWWWLMPMPTPIERTSSSLLRSAGLLLLALLVIGAWFARASLPSPNGISLYWPLLALLVGFIFFLKQLFAGRSMRANIALGLLAFLVPLTYLAGLLGIIPPGIYDLIARSWPALLVFIGLSIILRDRFSFGTPLAMLLSILLVVGLAAGAVSTRSNQARTEQQLRIEEEVPEEVTLLQINVETLTTDVEFFSSADESRMISAEYSGSRASALDVSFDEGDAGLATFTLREMLPEFPGLEELGRASLRIALPPDIALSVSFAGQDGLVRLDMAGLNLERLNMDHERGDALVTLPRYQPLSPSVQQDPGRLLLLNGNLRLVVPEEVGGRFVMNQANNRFPVRDELLYAVEVSANEWIMVARNYASAAVQLNYILSVPAGEVRLDVSSSD